MNSIVQGVFAWLGFGGSQKRKSSEDQSAGYLPSYGHELPNNSANLEAGEPSRKKIKQQSSSVEEAVCICFSRLNILLI